MEFAALTDLIKSAFCNLVRFKERGQSLEVITGFSTLNSKFVSVFITRRNGGLIITDNGWIDQNYYDTPLYEESEDVVDRVITHYGSLYRIKSTVQAPGVQYYYRQVKDFSDAPSAVLDVASFITGVVNAFCIRYRDTKEDKERESFKHDANEFLMANYSEQFSKTKALDDFPNIKYNAIIQRRNDLYLFTYVTGSSRVYFENDLNKSIVKFELASKSKYSGYIKGKLTLFNDLCDGYSPDKSKSIIELLSEKTTHEPIRWSERERVLELVPG